MADIRGFRGFRYDLGRVGSLSDVIAPPYDVIDAGLQNTLYHLSPYNAIRLELTREDPGDAETENKYTRTARTLKEWMASNTIRQDTARSLYLYEQEFEVEGTVHVRRGFFAGAARAVRPGQDLSARANPVRPEGRPPQALPGHGLQPVADFRTLPR